MPLHAAQRLSRFSRVAATLLDLPDHAALGVDGPLTQGDVMLGFAQVSLQPAHSTRFHNCDASGPDGFVAMACHCAPASRSSGDLATGTVMGTVPDKRQDMHSIFRESSKRVT